MDVIYAKGFAAGSNEYNIPTKYSSELINLQLKLLEKLFLKADEQDAFKSSRTSDSKVTTTDINPVRKETTQLPSTSRAAGSSKDSSNLAKKQKLNERNIRDYIPVVVEKGRMADKLERAAPYNMFLTAITDSKATHQEPLSITLQEILDESLGEIESSVQINFMIDIGWLLGHYYFAGIL